MSKTFKYSDCTKWNTPQRKTLGRIAKRLSKTTYIRAHKVAATPATPQYLVERKHGSKTAAHRRESLDKA
jgi:hypothetical protein